MSPFFWDRGNIRRCLSVTGGVWYNAGRILAGRSGEIGSLGLLIIVEDETGG